MGNNFVIPNGNKWSTLLFRYGIWRISPPSAQGIIHCSTAPHQSWLIDLVSTELSSGSRASHLQAADLTLHSSGWRALSHPNIRWYGFRPQRILLLEVGARKQQTRFKTGGVHKEHEFSSFQQTSLTQKTEYVVSVCQTPRTAITWCAII